MRALGIFLGMFLWLSTSATTPAYTKTIRKGIPVTQASADSVKRGFRGLSVVNERVIWMSGPKGLVGRTTNGGKSFRWRRIEGYAKMDFRTLHAFDKRNAVIATVGSPGVILRTSNGGKTWTEVAYRNDSMMFFDGVGFWDDQRGLIFGDPVKGRMFLAETMDGGRTWTDIPFENCPQLVEGEAAFAASGTTIRTLPNGHVYIATGGVKSRLWHSRDYGHHWEVFETPIIQGKPSQGIFSIAFWDTLQGIIVGGDYLNDSLPMENSFMTRDGGKTWKAHPVQKERLRSKGYRSCVGMGLLYPKDSYEAKNEWPAHFILTTGPGGTDLNVYGNQDFVSLLAFDNGACLPCESANTIMSSKDGELIYLCGGELGFAVIDTRGKGYTSEIRAFPTPKSRTPS